jgi:hypothetical protein
MMMTTAPAKAGRSERCSGRSNRGKRALQRVLVLGLCDHQRPQEVVPLREGRENVATAGIINIASTKTKSTRRPGKCSFVRVCHRIAPL